MAAPVRVQLCESAVVLASTNHTGNAGAEVARCTDEGTLGWLHVAKIFISYKHDAQPDVRLARATAERLAANHDVFIDSKIPIGEEWPRVIEQKLTESEFLIVFLSEAATVSEMIIEEIAIARRVRLKERRLKILPVRVAFEAPLPYDLGAALDRIQSASWRTDLDDQAVLDQLFSAIEQGAEGTDGVGLAAVTTLAADGNAAAADRAIAAPLPAFDLRWLDKLDAPGGAVRLNSPFYVRRNLDDLVENTIEQSGVTVLVKGSRQTGKSSLLARLFQHASDLGQPAVYIDFQRLDATRMIDLDALLRYLADLLTIKLKTNANPDRHWSIPLGPKDKLTSFIETEILSHAPSPILLLLDEVDRVFARPYRDDFFGLLRSWHNNRAFDPQWDQLNLVLAYATEASLLIADQNQSPFNVGETMETGDFTRTEVAGLNVRHGSPLQTDAEIDAVMALLSGHPFMTRRAFYLLVKQSLSFAELLAQAPHDDGPFADHLHRCWVTLTETPGTAQALKSALHDGACETDKDFYALRSVGLIRGSSRHSVQVRCGLYQQFFEDRL